MSDVYSGLFRLPRGRGQRKFHLYDEEMGEALCNYVDPRDSLGVKGRGLKSFDGVEASEKAAGVFCGRCLEAAELRKRRGGGGGGV